jgi:hypothetical protein
MVLHRLLVPLDLEREYLQPVKQWHQTRHYTINTGNNFENIEVIVCIRSVGVVHSNTLSIWSFGATQPTTAEPYFSCTGSSFGKLTHIADINFTERMLHYLLRQGGISIYGVWGNFFSYKWSICFKYHPSREEILIKKMNWIHMKVRKYD